ncbi:MAG TPA: hypothetical protein VEY87_12470 [Gaiellaceae bacterium]|nr:hypothetical protein [Gaiellaceae bacterium]
MTRVALFGVLAVAVFALAFAGGRVLDVGPRTVAEAAAHEADAPTGEDEGHADAAPAGLAVAERGFRLVAERTELRGGRGEEFVFRILDEGRTVRDFDVEHERRLHLVVVKRELDVFLHLHPEQRRDGSWVTRLQLPADGVYRAFADFTSAGERRTLGIDLFARGGGATPPPAPASPYATELRRDGERLEFRVTRGGRPVRFEPYLGAGGHLVVLREGDLAYIHAHADEDRLAFDVPFPTPGRYRLFLQFKADGSVHTRSFEVRA